MTVSGRAARAVLSETALTSSDDSIESRIAACGRLVFDFGRGVLRPSLVG